MRRTPGRSCAGLLMVLAVLGGACGRPMGGDSAGSGLGVAVLRAVVEAPGFVPYLHPEVEGRRPLGVRLEGVEIGGALPEDLRDRFVLVEEAEGGAVLEIGVEREGAEAVARVRFDVEGVVGTVRLASREGGWTRIDGSFAER